VLSVGGTAPAYRSTRPKATAAALLLAVAVTAQAAEPETLALACQGTETTEYTPGQKYVRQLSTGIIVDFTRRSVRGLLTPDDNRPVTVTMFNDVHIHFEGSDHDTKWVIFGAIDRITGEVRAHIGEIGPTAIMQIDFSLKCRATQRMF